MLPLFSLSICVPKLYTHMFQFVKQNHCLCNNSLELEALFGLEYKTFDDNLLMKRNRLLFVQVFLNQVLRTPPLRQDSSMRH